MNNKLSDKPCVDCGKPIELFRFTKAIPNPSYCEKCVNTDTDIMGYNSKNTNSHTVFFGKGCTHDAKTPIKIGGFDVYLGAKYHIVAETIDKVNYIVSLNGEMLENSYFGQYLNYIDAELPDRGGVPDTWGKFIDDIISLIKGGSKIVAYCTGSHGRTGVFAASLIAKMEPNIDDPVEEIRKRHCKHCVESEKQVKAVFALKGVELPQKYKDEFAPKTFTISGNTAPDPGPNGKTCDGRYYHHTPCKCSDCNTRINNYSNNWLSYKVCQCGAPTCNFNGTNIDPKATIKHHAKCSCVVTSNKGTTELSDDNHEWWCVCGVCMAIDSDVNAVCKNSDSCNCYKCVLEWKKSELTRETIIKSHPDTCECPVCVPVETVIPKVQRNKGVKLLEAPKQLTLVHQVEHDTNCDCTWCGGKSDIVKFAVKKASATIH